MPDYDPNNPQHPLDKWYEKNKRQLMPVLFICIPISFAFLMYMLATTLKYGSGWAVAIGLPALLVVVAAISGLVDFWDKNAD